MGGYFSFGNKRSSIWFETCGGERQTPDDKPDKIHKYSTMITGNKNAILAIYHNDKGTGELENSHINSPNDIIGTNKKIGVRQIGIWSDSDYTRHLYLFMDFKGDNTWVPVLLWSDRGQYTPIVKKLVKGAFKSPPPYRDYPYGEEAAKTSIVLGTATKAHHVWCRQINPAVDIHNVLPTIDTQPKIESKSKEDSTGLTNIRLLWSSDDTLKINNPSIQPGTYANDETNTILFASAIDAKKQNAMFGVNDGDAIWTGIDSKWYINHHIIDSEVIDSAIEFDLLMGAADEIRVQLGNKSAVGWILDNDYAFGGYEFVLQAGGYVYARVEYYYGINEAGTKTSSYGLAETIGNLKVEEFDPRREVHVKVSVKNKGDSVVGIINVGGKACQKIWRAKDWKIDEAGIPKGRVDSKDLLSLYKGVKHHWSIGRIRVGNKSDNGSLIKSIKVYKL